MKKKLICLFLCFAMMVPNVLAIDLYLDGKKLEPDTEPTIVNGRTLVPVRIIFEALGADVQWDGTTRTVTATKGNTTIVLKIDDTNAYVNDELKVLDTPAKIINNRTMVPVRFVSESLDAYVWWEDETRTVYVSTKPEYDGYTIAPNEIYLSSEAESKYSETFMFADGEIWFREYSADYPYIVLHNDEGDIFLVNPYNQSGFWDFDYFEDARICFLYSGYSPEMEMALGIYLETGDLNEPIIYPDQVSSSSDSATTPTPEPVTPAPAPVTPTPAPAPSDKTEEQSEGVYITKTGKRYHYKASCAGSGAIPSTLQQAISKGLTGCKKCT